MASMQPPKPLKKEQLEHKTDCARRSKFNGDKRRNSEEQGFSQRRKSQGLTVVEGTRAPSNVRPAVGRPGQPAGPPPQLTRAVSPPTSSKPFQPALRPVEPFNLPELTARQKALLKKKK